jgi:N-acetylglucosaminyl-diphospho-decaprenol L-rhamnosyltransferase
MMAETPQVTAVIVTYQSRQTIAAALDALYEAHVAGLAEVIVVDNASSDGTADFVAERYPWVTLVRSGENLGFGRGCNRGFERVATPYVLFMNPDAMLPPESLNTLVAFMDSHPKAGVAAPAIQEGDQLQEVGVLPTPWGVICRAMGMRGRHQRRPVAPGQAPFQTDWLCGAVILARCELMEELGGFDPRFFLYFEETDLCRRVLNRGFELWAVGEAMACHVGGASTKASGEALVSGCVSGHYYRSRFYYLCKHFGWSVAAITEVTELGVLVMRWILDCFRRKRDDTLAKRWRGPFLSLPTGEGVRRTT